MDYADPADKLASVTASDTTDLTGARALYVGGGGDVALRAVNSSETTVTLVGVPTGTILPIRVTRVMAATTATSIVALY
jgi:hypothetical protein